VVFDPLTWATSFFLNTAGKGLVDKHLKDLSSELGNTVNTWEADLPDDLHFNVEALFNHVSSGVDLDNFPARQVLNDTFKQSHIPSKDIWFNALIERWCQVRENIDDAHPFFLQPQDDAENYFRLLSDKLELVCNKNKDLFQVTVIDSLANISKLIQNPTKTKIDKSTIEIDVQNGLDNQLINELAVAGYVNVTDGVRRAVYLDEDMLYVHRLKAEKSLLLKRFERLQVIHKTTTNGSVLLETPGKEKAHSFGISLTISRMRDLKYTAYLLSCLVRIRWTASMRLILFFRITR